MASSTRTFPMATMNASTSRKMRRPSIHSRWQPRPHHQDANVKTHDFAYESGSPDPTALSQAVAAAQTLISPLLAEPVLLRTLLFIFGGCCSNVYTLESILTLSSSTGTLITFLQFLFITLYTLPSQLTFRVTSPPEPPPLQPTQQVWIPRLKRRRVPLKKWALFAAQFVAINLLNNAAFGYKISLPLHIILRSAGPVTSMMVGYIWTGRRYSARKVFSVMLLFLGVVMAALSDAGSKPTTSTSTPKDVNSTTTTMPLESSPSTTSALLDQAPGFALLTAALLLSAIMGIWSDTLYTKYGRSPAIATEQLFYGHLLSLPFFAVQYNALSTQYNALVDASPTIQPSHLLTSLKVSPVVNHLLLNSITQIVCISGVHHLSTQTSALTVSIVLNVRKVISLLLSIYLFGNTLPAGVLLGAAVVFIGGAVYGLPDKAKKKPEGNEKARDRPTESKKNR